MEILDYIIEEDSTVIDAIKKIDKNGKGIVYICKNQILRGTVTDGDIRRHLLNKGRMDDRVVKIMNIHPVFCNSKQRDQIQDKMIQKCIRSIPVVDRNNKIVDIVFSNHRDSEKKEQINVPVVIMAGGKGTRLYPYTQILPKPLIPIGEKTITENIMSKFEEYGCNQFNMIVNYKKHFIKSYFLDNENHFNVNFTEEEDFLGTGGGLKLLEGKYKNTFFMTNCDILIDEDFSKILKFHKVQQNIITMVCAEKNMTIPYGTVDIDKDGKALGINEKPQLSFITNTGFYVIEPDFLEMIPNNTFIHITDVIQNCINAEKKVGVYKISEDKWLDMGQMDELEKMRQKLNI